MCNWIPAPGVVHVVAEVRCYEVVTDKGIGLEVRGELRERPNVADAVGRLRIEAVRLVVKVDEGVVLHSIQSISVCVERSFVANGTGGTANALLAGARKRVV